MSKGSKHFLQEYTWLKNEIIKIQKEDICGNEYVINMNILYIFYLCSQYDKKPNDSFACMSLFYSSFFEEVYKLYPYDMDLKAFVGISRKDESMVTNAFEDGANVMVKDVDIYNRYKNNPNVKEKCTIQLRHLTTCLYFFNVIK